jgi:putative molybdopterin biosynthesis protein
LVRIPRFSEGVDAGTKVKVLLYRKPAEIERTIVAIGSHDLTLDLLAQFLAGRGDGTRLSSANVGSLGGLIALRRGEAHLAGSHLLDPQSGEYNTSYVRRYLPEQEVVLVTLVGREQGWIVPPGNPDKLSGWSDALNPAIRFVNRQRGAGTRVLLDYQLNQMGADAKDVSGYDREEYTHLAVAAAIASGTADAGLGIRAAARALSLDFVPLAQERYDLVIPKDHYESEQLRPLVWPACQAMMWVPWATPCVYRGLEVITGIIVPLIPSGLAPERRVAVTWLKWSALPMAVTRI